jgi:hypothetical protein
MTPGISLCESCRHLREVVSRKGSRFLLCLHSQHDARFPKYPSQPVLRCDGFELKELATSRPPPSFGRDD